LYSDYAGLFGGNSNGNEGSNKDSDEVLAEELTAKERLEEQREKEKIKKWNWYSLLYAMSKGDIFKLKDLFELNLNFFLTHKAFEIENKNMYEFYEYKRFNVIWQQQ